MAHQECFRPLDSCLFDEDFWPSRYIDEGGNPDSYTAEVFERANKANQLSKGKVESLQAFRYDISARSSRGLSLCSKVTLESCSCRDYLRNELERSGDRDRDGQGQGDGTVDQTSVPAAEEHQPARQGP